MENQQLLNVINQIPMYKVESSNINFIGYDENNRILKVIFNTNSSYVYFGIPLIIWEELKISESKGKYLTENVIKKPEQYKFIKIQ